MYELSNFYTEYSQDPQVFQDVFNIYSQIIELVKSYATQVSNNEVLSSVETYRTIPIQYARIDEATYDIADIVNTSQYIRQKYNGGQSLTDDTKQSFWDSLNISQKVDILDTSQKYLLLTIQRNDVLDKPLPKIIDLELYDRDNNKLIVNYDYVLQNNKVYLINTEISSPSENAKFCMKNIAIDMNTPEKLLGERIKLNYDDILTKPEYKEICQMLLYGALGGPTINNMKNALSSIVQMSNIKIYDKYNADVLRQGYWNKDGDIWSKDKLSDFDFLVSLPSDFVNNADKLNLFKNYMYIIKPSYTNFIISLLYPFFDTLNMKNKDVMNTKLSTSGFKDNVVGIEKETFGLFKTVIDSMTSRLLTGNNPNVTIKNFATDVINRLENLSWILQNSNIFDKIIVNEINSRVVDTKTTDIISNLGQQLYYLDNNINYFDACIMADQPMLPLSSVKGSIFCDNINVKYFK